MPERQNRFAAFESWNFRSYFVGQIVSSSGTWMQTFAQVWLVLQITDSSGHLGVTVALQYIPLLLFGAHAGV
ncbi:MAG: MFS transporter, partial [Actinobacteria bacterium]|nr:MFS transporter [Actinomycetota bacterium]